MRSSCFPPGSRWPAEALSAVVVSLWGGAPAGAEDWPGWRGPRHDGTSAETVVPWAGDGPRLLWKAAVGTGYSAVAVAGGSLFTMGNVDGRETVFCLDAATGRERWRYGYPCELKPLRGDLGGPGATPAADGDRVYAIGHEGHLACLEAATGKPAWTCDVRKDLGLEPSRYGFPSSPVVDGRLLLLNLGAGGIALEKASGRVAWRSAPGPGGYASPVPYAAGDRRCVAFFAPTAVVSVDAADGRERWRHPWQTQYDLNIASPLVDAGRLFISSGYDKGCALLEDGPDAARLLWQGRVMRNHFGSGVVRDGHVYGFDGNTHSPADCSLKCVALEDGRERWRHDGLRLGGLVLAGGNLVVLDERGELAIVEATPEAFRPLARAHVLGGRCWTPPALSDGRLVARNADGDVVCVELRKGP